MLFSVSDIYGKRDLFDGTGELDSIIKPQVKHGLTEI